MEWILDDAPLFNVQGANYASPREVAQVWHRRVRQGVELLLDHLRAKGKVWFATHRAAAEYVKREAGMK